MAELDISKTTTTDLTTSGADYLYSVDAAFLDSPTDQPETTYTFSKAGEYLGYYKTIPELKKAVDALAIWTAGKGYITDSNNMAILNYVDGWGEDTFQSIMENMLIMKKVIGDSFAEIIRDKETGALVNLKPLSPENMRIVVGPDGRIKRYEQISKVKGNKPLKFKPEEILHLCNDRIGDEIHGNSVIAACKWVIDARNEAMADYRKVLHRNVVPVRIIEVDTGNTAKRNALIAEYETAINKGEVLVIPKGTVEIKDTTITIQDPTGWISYLENFFYQAVGIPKIILGGSEEFTEASSKVGYLTFEQVYMREQRELEGDLWNQLGIEIMFERPVSIKENLVENEAANTGQTSFQPKEAEVNMERE